MSDQVDTPHPPPAEDTGVSLTPVESFEEIPPIPAAPSVNFASLETIPGTTDMRTKRELKRRRNQGKYGAHDAEGLTPRQRAFVELVVDYRGTLYWCAQVAGYVDPEQTIQSLYDNPYLVKGLLRRYHRRMIQLLKAIAPMPKLVHEIEKPRQREAYVPASWARKRAGEKGKVASVPKEAARSILGEGGT